MTAAPDRPAQYVYQARLPTQLGLAFMALLSFPVLVELPGGVSPGQILMLASLPLWFAAFLNRKDPDFDGGGLATAAILLCSGVLIFWSLISAFQVEDPFRSARQSVSLLTAFATFFLVAGTVTRERLFRYIAVLCFSLTATSIVTILAFAEPTLQSIVFQGRDRAFGFFKNPNQFGIAISTVLPVALAMMFAARKARPVWVGCVLFLVLGLMATGSKANLLVSAVTVPSCLILFSLVSYTGRQRVVMVILTALGCLVAGAFVVLLLSVVNPRSLELLSEVVIEGEATHSLVSRSVLWAGSLDALRANPILGVGAGERIFDLAHSHNIVLDYARTLGVPGLVVMSIKLIVILATCASTVLLALNSWRAELPARYLCIGLAFGPVAYIGANLSSDSLGPTTSPFLYTVLFLGLAGRNLLSGRG